MGKRIIEDSFYKNLKLKIPRKKTPKTDKQIAINNIIGLMRTFHININDLLEDILDNYDPKK